MISAAMEDHLKAIYTLGHAGPAVTRMCKKLARLGLVKHQPRRHRLLVLYLVEALGLPWDRVGAEADRREHVVSDKLEARLDAALGYPTRDPHGDPIPALDGSIDDPVWRRLGMSRPTARRGWCGSPTATPGCSGTSRKSGSSRRRTCRWCAGSRSMGRSPSERGTRSSSTSSTATSPGVSACLPSVDPAVCSGVA